MIDLLIKGGLIIDGTGSPGFHAAVGIEETQYQYFGATCRI